MNTKWIFIVLFAAFDVWADYVIPLTFFHTEGGKTEKICAIVVLADHYGRTVGMPDGLLPLLVAGHQPDEFFTEPFKQFNQAWYLKQIVNRTDIYGPNSSGIAGQVGGAHGVPEGSSSGIWFFRTNAQGQPIFDHPIFSVRFVGEDANGLVPSERDYEKDLNGAKPPKGPEGEKWAKTSDLKFNDHPTLGVIDLSKPSTEKLERVFRKGKVEIKSLARDPSDPTLFQRYFPEIVKIGYYFKMFQSSEAKLPEDFTQFSDGTPVPKNAGPFNSLLLNSCYGERMMLLYKSMGFKVYYTHKKEGEPTHYFMYGTVESMKEAADLRSREAPNSSTLISLDADLIRKINLGIENLRSQHKKISCEGVARFLTEAVHSLESPSLPAMKGGR